MSHSEISQESWRSFADAHSIGAVLDAEVVQIVPFGAFFEVAPGIHGLLHRTEWPDPSNDPTVGSTLSVRILAIDDQRQRVSLAVA
ncbi:S1 RNA-binding domain-containing protein [Nocardia sp. NPDC050712]|uniref:S1 RNA-binding domain-containing protein n=1 Tax=Nocardia sp. NPDC050712 TaxID=3155518 RepID=UPI0033D00BEF